MMQFRSASFKGNVKPYNIMQVPVHSLSANEIEATFWKCINVPHCDITIGEEQPAGTSVLVQAPLALLQCTVGVNYSSWPGGTCLFPDCKRLQLWYLRHVDDNCSHSAQLDQR